MEKIKSKKSYKTFHKRDKINIRKDEYTEKVKPVKQVNTKQSVFEKSTFKNIITNFLGWFLPDRKLTGMVAPKKTNKEAKNRSQEVRAKRNIARNSRKTNLHRGKRKGK